jgi:hypothetical protein
MRRSRSPGPAARVPRCGGYPDRPFTAAQSTQDVFPATEGAPLAAACAVTPAQNQRAISNIVQHPMPPDLEMVQGERERFTAASGHPALIII